MILYGIRNIQTKKPLRISIFSNEGGEFCNAAGARFETTDFSDVVYMVTDFKMAQKALKENPRWYNASIERPEWPRVFSPADYEIFDVRIS